MTQFRCCTEHHRVDPTNLLIFGVHHEQQSRPGTADT
ncbi:hypothetical protein M2387_002460 [Klebsiella sp. BIGb0407]|nr:hypothetical protein [Klebsiella sp. BIGb0407]